MRTTPVLAVAGALCALIAPPTFAFIYNTGHDIPPIGMSGGLRWDSTSRFVDGVDRSLVGGIAWNVEGGSFAAYRSQFTWGGAGAPTDAEFEAAIKQAFVYWQDVDPNPQLHVAAPFSFVLLPAVAATDGPTTGAEIDLLATDLGISGAAGGALSHPIDNQLLTLTSGVANYPSDAIGGVDINMNNRAGTNWTLPAFRSVLLHEIGHALGMGHPDLGLAHRFIDDNYDGTSEITASATLTNHFSHLVNPLDPANSPQLHLYTVPNSILGTNAANVRIVMERFGGIHPEGVNPLSSDDFAQRQFLYPVVPEPGGAALLLAALGSSMIRRLPRLTTSSTANPIRL